jgi:hypothetical protein
MAKKPAKKVATKKAAPASKPATKKVAKVDLVAELENQLKEIGVHVTEVTSNLEILKGGIKAAGGRMRKSLQVIKRTAQAMRKTTILKIKELKADRAD